MEGYEFLKTGSKWGNERTNERIWVNSKRRTKFGVKERRMRAEYN